MTDIIPAGGAKPLIKVADTVAHVGTLNNSIQAIAVSIPSAMPICPASVGLKSLTAPPVSFIKPGINFFGFEIFALPSPVRLPCLLPGADFLTLGPAHADVRVDPDDAVGLREGRPEGTELRARRVAAVHAASGNV